MLSFDSVEEVCESKSITLVIHPAIRRAVKGYEESFYIDARGGLFQLRHVGFVGTAQLP